MPAITRGKKSLFYVAVLLTVFFVVNYMLLTDSIWEYDAIVKFKQYNFLELLEIAKSKSDKALNMADLYYGVFNKKTGKTKQEAHNLGKDFNELFKFVQQCFQEGMENLANYTQEQFSTTFSETVADDSSQYTNKKIEPRCKPGIELVIVVTSRPSSIYQRLAIRNSWGRPDSVINQHLFKDKKFDFISIFAIGQTPNKITQNIIEKESQGFGDILQLFYIDSYENLTNKTLLTLEWLSYKCEPKFVLKTDDDCFVNLLSLEPWLHTLKSDILYVGKRNVHMPVIRNPKHRNYVAVEDFSEKYYEPYCSGGGYMLSGKILKNVTGKAKFFKQIRNEDAFIGIVMNFMNISPVHDKGFLPFVFTEKELRKRFACEWKSHFVMHDVKPRQQIVMHWSSIIMFKYPYICDSIDDILETNT